MNSKPKYTSVGNQKAYGGGFFSDRFGEQTSNGDKRDISLNTRNHINPDLGTHYPDSKNIDVSSKLLNFGIGEPSSLRDTERHIINVYERIQIKEFKPKNVIFDLPVGGTSSRNGCVIYN